MGNLPRKTRHHKKKLACRSPSHWIGRSKSAMVQPLTNTRQQIGARRHEQYINPQAGVPAAFGLPGGYARSRRPACAGWSDRDIRSGLSRWDASAGGRGRTGQRTPYRGGSGGRGLARSVVARSGLALHETSQGTGRGRATARCSGGRGGGYPWAPRRGRTDPGGGDPTRNARGDQGPSDGDGVWAGRHPRGGRFRRFRGASGLVGVVDRAGDVATAAVAPDGALGWRRRRGGHGARICAGGAAPSRCRPGGSAAGSALGTCASSERGIGTRGKACHPAANGGAAAPAGTFRAAASASRAVRSADCHSGHAQLAAPLSRSGH